MDNERKEINILQVNVQSIFKHKEEIHRTLIGGSYAAALISETWTKQEDEQSKKYCISGYNKVLTSRHDGYGGAAIYIHKDYGFQTLTIPPTSHGSQCAAIYVPLLKLVLAAVYSAPSIPLQDFRQDLNLILTELARFPKVIVGGDFNCHHTQWH